MDRQIKLTGTIAKSKFVSWNDLASSLALAFRQQSDRLFIPHMDDKKMIVPYFATTAKTFLP